MCVCAHACYFGSFQSPEQTHAKEVGFMDCVFQSTIEFRKWIHHTLLWEMVAKSDSRTSSLLHQGPGKIWWNHEMVATRLPGVPARVGEKMNEDDKIQKPSFLDQTRTCWWQKFLILL